MARRSEPQPPAHHPHRLVVKGVVCAFEGTAPITGDLFYTGVKGDRQKGDQQRVHIVVTNPNAREHQRQYYLRGG